MEGLRARKAIWQLFMKSLKVNKISFNYVTKALTLGLFSLHCQWLPIYKE